MITIRFPKCSECGRKDLMLVKHKNENGKPMLMCCNCIEPTQIELDEVLPFEELPVKSSYMITWKLRDEKGKEWTETMKEMTMTDFEVVYGNNVYVIVSCLILLNE